MNKRTNKKGFTLAELMLAVAIIVILGALVTVGVFRYLRSLRLLEMDNAAKELYFAAQNRITAELVSGDLGRLKTQDYSDDVEKTVTIDGKPRTLHVVKGPISSDGSNTLLDELLPFGSIDDTIRSSGSYIITYTFKQEDNTADIWDVWYTAEWRGVNHKFNIESELQNLYDNTRGDDNDTKNVRKNYGVEKAVIGHYGSEGISLDRGTLAMVFQLVNKEALYLTGTVTADKVDLKDVLVNLIVEGRTSNAIKTMTPSESGISVDQNTGGFYFILDNVTKDEERFAQQFTVGDDNTTAFIPGEDIKVTVEVYTNAKLANIEKASARDNSLFQYVKTTTDSGTTIAEAGIGYIRHLQNLSNAVSNVKLGVKDENNDDHTNRLGINSALQTDDLYWNRFVGSALPGSATISGNIYYGGTNPTSNSFYPIDIEGPETNETYMNNTYFTYHADYTVEDQAGNKEQKNHTIFNLKVDANDAGLFGTAGSNDKDLKQHGDHLLKVEHLNMKGAQVTGSSTAGTVMAKEVKAVVLNDIEIDNATVTASGNAGGAVGQAKNGLDLYGVRITGTAAISATSGNAGGLIGEFAGTSANVHVTINNHDPNNSASVVYISAVGATNTSSVTVTSTGTGKAAGGLVGAITAGLPTISNSYSTALVTGETAGGLIGTITACESGSEIKSCYVGGHTVNGTAKYDTDPTHCNVQGTTVAGGFIGSIGTNAVGLTVNNSYTTASVSGDQAGGFIGSVGANTIVSNCYAVGLVQDKTPGTTPPGAFVGGLTNANYLTSKTGTLNYYFELINGEEMPAVAADTVPGFFIEPAEKDLTTYNDFVTLGAVDTFSPYDDMLKTMFGTKYFLPTVSELSGDANAPSTHVGDWQPVDTLVFNTAGSTTP